MKDFFTKIKNNIRQFFSFKRINPHYHWSMLLRIFIVFSFILIVFSIFLLYKIKNQEIFNTIPNSDGKVITVNEKLLKKINDSFDKKNANSLEVKNNQNSYNDPSLR